MEDVLRGVVERIPSRSELNSRIDSVDSGDVNLDVSDIDDVLAMHELDADDRSTADGGGTVNVVNSRPENTIFNLEVLVLDEVGLISLRLSNLVVLDNLILEMETELFHLSRSQLEAVLDFLLRLLSIGSVRKNLYFIIAALFELPAEAILRHIMSDGDGIEVKTSGGVPSDSGVAGSVGLFKSVVLTPRSDILVSEEVMHVLIIVITVVIAIIVSAETNGTTTIVLLVVYALESFSLVGARSAGSSLHLSDRVSDPGLIDILDNEGGVVRSVDLARLDDLQSELGHVVVSLGSSGGTTLISDIEGKLTILELLEGGVHGEILAALSPCVDGNVLPDELVSVGGIESKAIVDVISGDGGNSLINEVTILDSPLTIKVKSLLFARGIEVNLVLFAILLELFY